MVNLFLVALSHFVTSVHTEVSNSHRKKVSKQVIFTKRHHSARCALKTVLVVTYQAKCIQCTMDKHAIIIEWLQMELSQPEQGK